MHEPMFIISLLTSIIVRSTLPNSRRRSTHIWPASIHYARTFLLLNIYFIKRRQKVEQKSMI